MTTLQRVTVTTMLVATPTLCLAADSDSVSFTIGRVLGIMFFGYLVLRFFNRKKS